MASEIKVDTVSEKTSANGVTIDGVNIKDSKIVTANSVDSDVYVDGSIDTAHLAADAITGAKIADDAINSEHYTDGSIDTAHIADGQITIGKLATAVLTGATDIGAAIVDADLLLVDDGAGGTLRKTAASRLKTYAGYDGAISTLDIDGGTDIGAALADADEIIVDDGGGGTNRRCDMSRVKTYIGDNTPAFLVTLSGNQEIANSTLTKITFDTEAFDSDGKFASNKFTPTVAGKYFIVLSGRMSGFGDGEEFNLRFQKNGSAHNFGDLKIVSSGSNPLFLAANANLVVDLDADDFIEGYITHNVGAAANLDATYTFMAGYKINGA